MEFDPKHPKYGIYVQRLARKKSQVVTRYLQTASFLNSRLRRRPFQEVIQSQLRYKTTSLKCY